jgi:acyl-CoA synthetase (AMP-forming)/AMP-acid ligase II
MMFGPVNVNGRQIDGARFAAALAARGVARGDRVAVFAANRAEVVEALLAHHRLGAIHVPINPGYQEAELEHILIDSGAKLLLVDDERGAIAERVARVPLVNVTEIDGATPLPARVRKFRLHPRSPSPPGGEGARG